MTPDSAHLREFLAAEVCNYEMTVAEYLDQLALSIWRGTGSEKHGWTGGSDWRDYLYTTYKNLGHTTNDLDNWTMDEQRAADRFIDMAIQNRHALEHP